MLQGLHCWTRCVIDCVASKQRRASVNKHSSHCPLFHVDPLLAGRRI